MDVRTPQSAKEMFGKVLSKTLPDTLRSDSANIKMATVVNTSIGNDAISVKIVGSGNVLSGIPYTPRASVNIGDRVLVVSPDPKNTSQTYAIIFPSNNTFLGVPDHSFWDGWIPSPSVATYGSSLVFTVGGDLSGKIARGDPWKILSGGTLGYFNTTGISITSDNTTAIEVRAGTDFMLNSSGIESAYYSKMYTPGGFPVTFNYGCSVVSGTGTLTSASVTGKYAISGNIMDVWNVITITTNGTANTDLRVPLPIPFANANYSGYGARTDALMALSVNGALGAATIDIRTAANGYPGADGKVYATHVRHHIA